MSSPMTPGGVWTYNPAFDGIRAVAIIPVMAFHAAPGGLNGGFIGVDVFFVLSGFLITCLLSSELQREGCIDIARFVLNRAIRLLPALVFGLIGLAALAPFAFPAPKIAAELWPVLAYISDYSFLISGKPDLFQHSWSLSVETKFYAIWPAVLIVFWRLGANRSLRALGILWLAAMLWHALAYDWLGWRHAYYAADARLSGFLLGAIIAQIPVAAIRRHARLLTPSGIVALGLLAMLALTADFYSPGSALAAGPLTELAAACMILAVIDHRTLLARALSSGPLVRIGQWSYGLYIWHYPIARYARDNFDPLTSLVITAGLSIFAAAISHEYLERPARAWLRRLTGRLRFAE